MLQCLSLVWAVSRGRWNIHRHTHRSITHMNAMCSYGIQVKVNLIYFLCLVINSYACAELHAVQVMLLTCDLPNGAEYIEFFWVQRFNVVVDIPENVNERLEKTNKKLLNHSMNSDFQVACSIFPQTQFCMQGTSTIPPIKFFEIQVRPHTMPGNC